MTNDVLINYLYLKITGMMWLIPSFILICDNNSS